MSLLWRSAFFVWLTTITVFSLMPHPPAPQQGLLAWDKLQHAAAYGMLTFLGAMAFTFYRKDPGQRFLPAAGVATVAGGMLEVAQGVLTVSRTAEVADLLADAVGAAVVVGWACLLGAARPVAKSKA